MGRVLKVNFFQNLLSINPRSSSNSSVALYVRLLQSFFSFVCCTMLVPHQVFMERPFSVFIKAEYLSIQCWLDQENQLQSDVIKCVFYPSRCFDFRERESSYGSDAGSLIQLQNMEDYKACLRPN